MDVYPLNRATALSGVENCPVDKLLSDTLHVHIRTHIGRVISTQLKIDRLDLAGRRLAEPDAAGRGASKRDRLDLGKLSNLIESIKASNMDNLEDIGWKTGLCENFQESVPKQRGLWRGPENNAVPRQESGNQSVDSRQIRIL